MNSRLKWAALFLAATSVFTLHGGDLPDLGGTDVTLSWDDFAALVESAWKDEQPEPQPPRGYALTRAVYRASLSGESLRLDAALELSVFSDRWQTIPLTSGFVLTGKSTGEAVITSDEGRLTALVKGRGEYKLKLELLAGVRMNPGVNKFEAGLPAAGVNLMNLEYEYPFGSVKLPGTVTRTAGRNRIFAALEGETLSIDYELPIPEQKEPAGETVEREPRIHLTSIALAQIGDGAVKLDYIYEYDILRAPLTEVLLEIPSAVEVFVCSGKSVADWDIVRNEEGVRLLKVGFTGPVEGKTEIAVTAETPVAGEEVSVRIPLAKPLDCDREIGYIGCSAPSAELRISKSGGLIPINPSEAPPPLTELSPYPLIYAFKFVERPVILEIEAVEHESLPVLKGMADMINAATIITGDGTSVSWLKMKIRTDGLRFLELSGLTGDIWSLEIGGEQAKPMRGDGGKVLIPLPHGKPGSKVLDLVLVFRGEEVYIDRFGTADLRLPALSVPVGEMGWTVYLPLGREYIRAGGNMKETQFSGENGTSSDSETFLAQEQIAARKMVQKSIEVKGPGGPGGQLPVISGMPSSLEDMAVENYKKVLLTGIGERPEVKIYYFPGIITGILGLLHVPFTLVGGFLSGAILMGIIRRHKAGKYLKKAIPLFFLVPASLAAVYMTGFGAGSYLLMLGLSAAAAILMEYLKARP